MLAWSMAASALMLLIAVICILDNR